MIVCGLDLSLTSAGIAILVDGTPKVITSVGHKGRDGSSYAHRSRRIVSQSRAVMSAIGVDKWPIVGGKPDLAVMEGLAFNQLDRPSGADSAGLWWGVLSALLAKRIPVAVIAPSTLKVWFTGDGTASKLRMLDTARGMFREAVSTHDEADSLALATAGAHWLGDPIPFVPGERQLEAFGKVDWPSRDETNNTGVSKTVTDDPNIARNVIPAAKTGIHE